jgi:hypothetical protein
MIPRDAILARFDRNGSVVILLSQLWQVQEEESGAYPCHYDGLDAEVKQKPGRQFTCALTGFWQIYMQASVLSILTKYQ